MKLNSTDKALLRAVERGEWRPTGIGQRERLRYKRHARATLHKYCRLTISLSKNDFDALGKRALAAGVSREALAATALHDYATGRLREDLKGRLRSTQPSATETAAKMTDRTKTAAVAVAEPEELIVPRLLNMRQAGKYLGCSFWTIRDYVLQGLIPVVQLPPLKARSGARQRETLRRVVIDGADLDRFIEARKSRAGVSKA